VRSSYARPHCQARPRPPASIGAVYPLEDVRSEAQRRVLALLARIPIGITEDALVVAHGFDRTLVAGLVGQAWPPDGVPGTRRRTVCG
jgi:hypothetical protein